MTVTSISGTANIALDVAGAHPAVLEAAPVRVRHRRGDQDQRIHGDRAWTSVLFVTPDLGPLVVPGVVSLGIGNGNANALIVASRPAHDNAGEGVVQITWPGTLQESGFLSTSRP